jgi:Uma2 family endonuclease
MVSLSRNDYEPDVCFFGVEKEKKFHKQDQMQFPAPDFVVEVLSPSTEKHDREVKFKDYAAHHVSEYWIIDPDKKFVEQYLLKDGAYELNLKSKSGIITALAIEGFSIPIEAIFDSKENLKTLKQIQK